MPEGNKIWVLGDEVGMNSTIPSAWKPLYGDGRRFPPLQRGELHLLKTLELAADRNGLVVGIYYRHEKQKNAQPAGAYD